MIQYYVHSSRHTAAHTAHRFSLDPKINFPLKNTTKLRSIDSTRHTHLTQRAYDSTAGNQPCATTSAVPLHPHAQAMQHRSGAANFVEAGLTKRHTAQRKASGAATAEQHMSYAYPALAPSRAVVTQGIPRGGCASARAWPLAGTQERSPCHRQSQRSRRSAWGRCRMPC